MNISHPDVVFSSISGSRVSWCIPWDVPPKELQVIEKMIALTIDQIRSYQEQVGHRHEWWLKWKEFAP